MCCVVLCGVTLFCIVLLHCTALQCTALYCVVLYYTVLYCLALFYFNVPIHFHIHTATNAHVIFLCSSLHAYIRVYFCLYPYFLKQKLIYNIFAYFYVWLVLYRFN